MGTFVGNVGGCNTTETLDGLANEQQYAPSRGDGSSMVQHTTTPSSKCGEAVVKPLATSVIISAKRRSSLPNDWKPGPCAEEIDLSGSLSLVNTQKKVSVLSVGEQKGAEEGIDLAEIARSL